MHPHIRKIGSLATGRLTSGKLTTSRPPPPQVSIDLFVMAQAYADLATLGTLCAGTCGSLYHWPTWNPQLDADEFFNDLRWAAMRPQVRHRRRPRCRHPRARLPRGDRVPAAPVAIHLLVVWGSVPA